MPAGRNSSRTIRIPAGVDSVLMEINFVTIGSTRDENRSLESGVERVTWPIFGH